MGMNHQPWDGEFPSDSPMAIITPMKTGETTIPIWTRLQRLCMCPNLRIGSTTRSILRSTNLPPFLSLIYILHMLFNLVPATSFLVHKKWSLPEVPYRRPCAPWPPKDGCDPLNRWILRTQVGSLRAAPRRSCCAKRWNRKNP